VAPLAAVRRARTAALHADAAGAAGDDLRLRVGAGDGLRGETVWARGRGRSPGRGAKTIWCSPPWKIIMTGWLPAPGDGASWSAWEPGLGRFGKSGAAAAIARR
jgi:hypothetical protein